MIKTATVLKNYSLFPLQTLLQHLPPDPALGCPSPLPRPTPPPFVVPVGKYPIEFCPVETQSTTDLLGVESPYGNLRSKFRF